MQYPEEVGHPPCNQAHNPSNLPLERCSPQKAARWNWIPTVRCRFLSCRKSSWRLWLRTAWRRLSNCFITRCSTKRQSISISFKGKAKVVVKEITKLCLNCWREDRKISTKELKPFSFKDKPSLAQWPPTKIESSISKAALQTVSNSCGRFWIKSAISRNW